MAFLAKATRTTLHVALDSYPYFKSSAAFMMRT